MDARTHTVPMTPARSSGRPQAPIDGPGGDGMTMEPAMRLALEASFGSAARWREDFVACAQKLGDGPGRVMLVFQPRAGRLVNRCNADPGDARVDSVPMLAFDLGTPVGARGRGAGVDAFLDRIDWAAVYAGYQRAVHAASEHLGAGQDELGDALVLDVRRAGVFEQARTMIPGADWRDPAEVATWSAALPADREVVVYCVYGHEVGRATAMRLRAAGLQARYLRGGIDGWQAAGRPLADKRASPTR